MYEKSKLLYTGFKRERIDKFVSNCTTCNRHRPLERISPITLIVASQSWEIVQMDCVDMRNYSEHNDGYGWMLNIIDSYSKFVFLFTMKTKSAEDVLVCLKHVFRSEGAPIIIQSDNGLEFINSSVGEYLKSKNIVHRRGRPKHPQNQGQVERFNQTICRAISKNPI